MARMNETSMYFLLVAVLIGIFYYLLDLRARRLEERIASLARDVHGEGAWGRADERIRELLRAATELEENVVRELSAETERARTRFAEIERRLVERMDEDHQALTALMREGTAVLSQATPTTDTEPWGDVIERIEVLGASLRARAETQEAELRSVGEHLAHLGERVDQLQQAGRRRATATGPEASIAALLEEDGFERVTLLGQSQEHGKANSTRYVVEAVRQGVSYKGHVSVKDGAFVERDLRPAYSMFP